MGRGPFVRAGGGLEGRDGVGAGLALGDRGRGANERAARNVGAGDVEQRRVGMIGEPAQAGDHAHRDVRQIGMLSERFAGVNVGKVHFNKWNPHCQQGIPQRNAGVGKSCRVNNDKVRTIGARGMNTLNQLVFPVALQAFARWPCSAACWVST